MRSNIKMHLERIVVVAALLPLVLLLIYTDKVIALRDVRVEIPRAVRRGEKAILKCLYDLEGEKLYAVKWYKGGQDFFNFVPDDETTVKVFPRTGVKVVKSASNESHIVLDAVNLATSGKYTCEVTADAPSFAMLMAGGDMEVVEVPGRDPFITGIRPRYRVGEILRGNCTARQSKPAANLTWSVNGHEVNNPSYIRQHKSKDIKGMETARSYIQFLVTTQHFVYGKLKLRCTAHIHDVYWKSVEKSIEEKSLQQYANTIEKNHNKVIEDYETSDEFDAENNDDDDNDTYMTHIKGILGILQSDASSLNASGANMQHLNLPLLLLLVNTFCLVLPIYYCGSTL